MPQPGLLKVRPPKRRKCSGRGFVPGGPSLASGTAVGEEGQKSLDGRSVSFYKMGIITHGAAENIWWNAGPALRKPTRCQLIGVHFQCHYSAWLGKPDCQGAQAPFFLPSSHRHPKARVGFEGLSLLLLE